MKNRKIIIAIIAVLAVVLLGIKGKGLLEKRKEQVATQSLPEKQMPVVTVVKAKEGILKNKNSYLAKVEADESVKLSTKLVGYVEKIFVNESQRVKKGDLLIRIDSSELRSSIDSLQAVLSTQKSDYLTSKRIYERNKKLYAIGGIAKEKLELSKVSLSAKKSIVQSTVQKISQLKHQLSYLQIKAPFDGQVESVFLHEGDLAAAGKPILSMNNGRKKLLFSFSPGELSQIKPNLPVFIGNKKAGVVKTIYSVSKNGLVTAESSLDIESNLPSGSNIEIDILTKRKRGCLLPQNTILHKKDSTYIMIYKKGKFVPKKVDILLQDNKNVLISDCPSLPVAYASEVKLSKLPAFDEVVIRGVDHE